VLLFDFSNTLLISYSLRNIELSVCTSYHSIEWKIKVCAVSGGECDQVSITRAALRGHTIRHRLSFISIAHADGCKALEPGYEYSLSKSGFFIKADSDVYRHLVSYTLPSFADGLMVIIYSGVGLICLLIFVVVVAAMNRKKIPDDEEP
jgi:hypothetical protein